MQLHFDTELLSLDLTGPPVLLPLASDPGNALGDSTEGYGWVDSTVRVTLSSQRPVSEGGPGPGSFGMAYAWPLEQEPARAGAIIAAIDPEPFNPADWDGQLFQVDSFFDVFFDIMVTDVDARAGRNYAGMADGASIGIPDNGPANMFSRYQATFDVDAPNFGLIPPPELFPYIGHTTIEIPLGGDINGNGKDDKIKFTLVSHIVEDEGRSFIILPDGTIIDEFSTAAEMEGAVVDEDTDPPFVIPLSGPTVASSFLLNAVIPLPGAVWLGLGLLGGLGVVGKLRRRKHTV